MNKKVFLFGIPILVLAATVFAYVILTTNLNVNIKEGQEFAFWDWSKSPEDWTELPLNTGTPYTLPDRDINAGDYYDVMYKATNPNQREIQYTVTSSSGDPDVTLSFVCVTSGLEYYVTGEGTTDMTVAIRNPAGATNQFAIRNTVNAGAPPSTTVTITSDYERMEVDPNITWNTCP